MSRFSLTGFSAMTAVPAAAGAPATTPLPELLPLPSRHAGSRPDAPRSFETVATASRSNSVGGGRPDMPRHAAASPPAPATKATAAAMPLDEYLGVEYPDFRRESAGSQTLFATTRPHTHTAPRVRPQTRNPSQKQQQQQPGAARSHRTALPPRRPAGPPIKQQQQAPATKRHHRQQKTENHGSKSSSEPQLATTTRTSSSSSESPPDTSLLIRQREELNLRSHHLQHLLQEASEIIAKQAKEIQVLRHAIAESGGDAALSLSSTALRDGAMKQRGSARVSSHVSIGETSQQPHVTTAAAVADVPAVTTTTTTTNTKTTDAMDINTDEEAYRTISDLLVTVATLRSELTIMKEKYAIEQLAMRNNNVRCMTCGAWVNIGASSVATAAASVSPSSPLPKVSPAAAGPWISCSSPNESTAMRSVVSGAPSLASVATSPVRMNRDRGVTSSMYMRNLPSSLSSPAISAAAATHSRAKPGFTNQQQVNDEIVEVEMPSLILSRLALRKGSVASIPGANSLHSVGSTNMVSAMANAGSVASTYKMVGLTEPRVADLDEFEYISDDDDDKDDVTETRANGVHPRHRDSESQQSPTRPKNAFSFRSSPQMQPLQQDHQLMQDSSAFFGGDSITSSAIGSLLDDTEILADVHADDNVGKSHSKDKRAESPMLLQRVYRSSSKEVIVASATTSVTVAAPTQSKHDINKVTETRKSAEKESRTKTYDRTIFTDNDMPKWAASRHASPVSPEARTSQSMLRHVSPVPYDGVKRALPLPDPMLHHWKTSSTMPQAQQGWPQPSLRQSRDILSNVDTRYMEHSPTRSTYPSNVTLAQQQSPSPAVSAFALHMNPSSALSNYSLSRASIHATARIDRSPDKLVIARERDALEQELLLRYTQLRSLEHKYESEIANRDRELISLRSLVEASRRNRSLSRPSGDNDSRNDHNKGSHNRDDINDDNSQGSNDSVIVHHFSFAQDRRDHTIRQDHSSASHVAALRSDNSVKNNTSTK